MSDHGEGRHHDRQRQRRPEAAPEVDQLGVLALVEARHLRLERHAALGAAAGMILADLRMHGAGVDRSRRRIGGVAATLSVAVCVMVRAAVCSAVPMLVRMTVRMVVCVLVLGRMLVCVIHDFSASRSQTRA
jgi:hypothetical protein